MKIREWTLKDAKNPRLAQFLKQFEQASGHVKVDVEYTFKKYYSMMEKGIAKILIAEDEGEIAGAIGFIISRDLHEDVKVSVETFWFVDPKHREGGVGIMLLDAYEANAEQSGCQNTAMVHMVDSYPDILEKLYLKRGYRLIEKHYVKRFK